MAFFAITNYSSMLNRVGWATLAAWVLALLTLNQSFAPIRERLPQAAVKVPGTDFEVPLGVLLIAICLAVLCRALKLHDLLSDLFGIRRRFDVKEILLPMAAAAGVSLSFDQQAAVEKQRRDLIGQVFYRYVSSTAAQPAIDPHNITIALDQWSWYWIILEVAAVAFVTAAVSVLFGSYALAYWLVAGILAAVWLLQYLRTRSIRYAQDQVKLILMDSSRKDAVAKAFRAL